VKLPFIYPKLAEDGPAGSLAAHFYRCQAEVSDPDKSGAGGGGSGVGELSPPSVPEGCGAPSQGGMWDPHPWDPALEGGDETPRVGLGAQDVWVCSQPQAMSCSLAFSLSLFF